MESLRALLSANPAVSLAVGGLIIGLFFGFVVQRTNFCTMGSISDMLSFDDSRRFRAWILSAVVAVVGAQILHHAGAVDLSKSMYRSATFDWAGAILGGLIFGFGMVFAGGCASRNLVRAGSGDLRSLFVVIIIAIAGYMTIGGLFGPARAALAQATSINLKGFGLADQGLGTLLAHATRMSADTANIAAAAALALIVGGWCFADARFRASRMHVVSGLLVGLAVVAGWALTGLAADELADSSAGPASLTFVRPAGDALEWLQRFTAQRIPGFGVATVFGVLLGAFLGAVTSGRFHVATFSDASDTRRNIFGAVLMGMGGVVALGCTVGQAVTGVSTLALASFVVFAAIVGGGVLGVKTMERIA